MVKYYVTYASEAESEARRAIVSLAESGLSNSRDSEKDDTAALAAADFLFVVLTEPKQVDDPVVRKTWEFFDNEIRWKRKPHGEILFLAADDSAVSSLPIRLKKYGYYLISEVADAAEYCLEVAADAAADDVVEKEEKALARKEIKYTPAADSVKQPEFSPKVPGIPSYDGKPPEKREKVSAACRDDHYFQDDLDKSINRNKAQKRSNMGCIIAVVVALIVVVAAIFIIAIVLSVKVPTWQSLVANTAECVKIVKTAVIGAISRL